MPYCIMKMSNSFAKCDETINYTAYLVKRFTICVTQDPYWKIKYPCKMPQSSEPQREIPGRGRLKENSVGVILVLQVGNYQTYSI
jgi:hypothetical protein